MPRPTDKDVFNIIYDVSCKENIYINRRNIHQIVYLARRNLKTAYALLDIYRSNKKNDDMVISDTASTEMLTTPNIDNIIFYDLNSFNYETLSQYDRLNLISQSSDWNISILLDLIKRVEFICPSLPITISFYSDGVMNHFENPNIFIKTNSNYFADFFRFKFHFINIIVQSTIFSYFNNFFITIFSIVFINF